MFIKSLFEPLQDFEENIFYDVSTWHLPSAFDLTMHRHQSDLPASWTAYEFDSNALLKSRKERQIQDWEDTLAFAFEPTELDSARVVAALHRVGAHLRVATRPFESVTGEGTRQWPRGTFLLLKQPNLRAWKRIHDALSRVVKSVDVDVDRITVGMTPTGPDLGSDTTMDLPRCNPLLIVGSGTRSYSAGVIWHFLDVRMQQASTLVEAERFESVDLHDYTCVILPEGSYSNWDSTEVGHLQEYVRSGGTVIAVSSAIAWLQSKQLIATTVNEAEPEEEPSPTSKPPAYGDARSKAALQSIAGAFFSTTVDRTHPIAYGVPDSLLPVFRDHTRRFAIPSNPYQLVARYENVIAGYVSERNRERLLGSAAAWCQSSGSGRYILLADNPIFRGYVRGSEKLLTNAIQLGPPCRFHPLR